MSPRLTNILLALALLGCGIYGYQLHSRLQAMQADADAFKAERDRLNRRIAELKETKPSPVEPVADTQEGDSLGGRKPGRPGFPPTDSPPPDSFRGGDYRDRFIAMLDNPEAQRLMAIQQKAALDSRFASLFKSLNLSPADLEKFKSLLVEKQTAVMDARAAARAQGLTGPDNRDALRQVIANAQSEVDNNIRSTLGDAAFAQYQNYEQTIPERNVVNQLQQRLSYSSAPLTDEQSNQVVALLAANSTTNSQGANAGSATRGGYGQFRNGGGSVPITDSVIAGSQGILNSTQISALTQLQQEQQAQAQIAAQLRANRQSSPAGTGTAAPAAGTPAPAPAKP